ncbi:DegQ family serine endoprotease [Polycladidibacter stylochi]|uniref:DegQ family serine endoprotease n=1 Tax=Polycladidibacter stylochi TaxID=1807766 RepID=UPI0012E39945|nr:DegQ family serine endoprotease [Pseudovibrio stylochi]
MGLAIFSSAPYLQSAQAMVPQSAGEVKLTFAPIVKKVAPAVVNVYASRRVRERAYSPFGNDPFFQQFFGGRSPFGSPRTRERVKSSLGSGVIISKEGIIITNHHVIKDADAVRVVLADRREYDAKILLKDERTDLAVLKIDGDGTQFPFVEFANSDALNVGDLVLAIGNPFGVGQTVTQGIVSAVARTQVGVSDYQFFIQTDAAINPGNSGGALVDVNGRLVGVNTAIFTRSGGSNGIGFAIPANMAKVVSAAAGHGDVVRRPWIGAQVQAVSRDIADSLGMKTPKGVLVTSLAKKSPAEQAGIEVGDLISAINGEEVNDPNSFGYRLATQPIDSKAKFALIRDGKKLSVDVHMAVAPETIPRDSREIDGRSPLTGATVMNLSPAVAEELRLMGSPEGVVISDVKSDSQAAYVGFQRGDIILGVNGRKVKNTRDLSRLLRKNNRTWHLEFMRGGHKYSTTLRL